jgi:hypothetical protein
VINRRPNPSARYTWARIPGDGYCTWRLFGRTEVTRRVVLEARTFPAGTPRFVIAAELRRMRGRLRSAVDALDFAALGLPA